MKTTSLIKQNIKQLAFVFCAFALMAVVSALFTNSIIKANLSSATNEALFTVEANIHMALKEPESALLAASYAVRDMIVRENATQDDIRDYFKGISMWLKDSHEQMVAYHGINGVIRGEYMSDHDWMPGADYVYEKRPWYIAAKNAKGAVGRTGSYLDLRTKDTIISISQEIFDPNSNSLGVVAIDIEISKLATYVTNLQQSYGGYGILLDEDLFVVAHPDDKYALNHVRLREISGEFSAIADDLRRGNNVYLRKVTNAKGILMIAFFQKLYNNWYIGLLIPYYQYYTKVFIMSGALSVLGILLMFMLSFFLLRLAAEKQKKEEESHAKSSFLAHMSHEIRTPMNAIIGMSEMLLRREIPNEAREDAFSIKQAGENLVSIINDILDFSKIESGKLEVVVTEYQLDSLLNDVISVIRARIMEKSLLFVTNIDSKLPKTLIGDEVRLRQVLLNILSNAVKYTREGYISITVDGIREEEGNNITLALEIADTGIGIKEEDIPKIFQDFSRFDTHKNKGIQGTGLGLAITKNLCELMGGGIDIYSKYGVGSVFTVKIPQKISQDLPFAEVKLGGKLNVLIYEARVPYANSIVCTIDNLGVRCALAMNREKFLQYLSEAQYSHIFVSSQFFESAKKMMEDLSIKTTIVLLAEYGENIISSDTRVVAMPAHSISVANIFNDVSQIFHYERKATRFTAPTARILLVDDIPTNLKVAAGLMAPYEVKIFATTKGKDAVELAGKSRFDIIFMDHMMPEMDGVEATRRIRALSGEGGKSTIIALTANAVSGMKEMFLANGFNDYIAKPIDISKLNALLDKWIPDDKKVRKHEQPQQEERKPEELDFTVDGLDVKRGLAQVGGKTADYIDALALFCKDASDRLESLSALYTGELAEGGLDALIKQMHALKSASGNIGAEQTSMEAAALEKAGSNKDLVYISENVNGFKTRLSKLVGAIRTALSAREEKRAGEGYPATETLLSLSDALLKKDVGAADRLIAELEQGSFKTEVVKRVAEIANLVLVSDYEKAAQLAYDMAVKSA